MTEAADLSESYIIQGGRALGYITELSPTANLEKPVGAIAA